MVMKKYKAFLYGLACMSLSVLVTLADICSSAFMKAVEFVQVSVEAAVDEIVSTGHALKTVVVTWLVNLRVRATNIAADHVAMLKCRGADALGC